jgi:predicted nucleic acid-binding protein
LSLVFWDTNLFIYLLEGGAHAGQVAALRERMRERGDQLVTSAMTLAEVLVKPLAENRHDLVDQYEQALTSAHVLLIPFDRSCARTYARLRQHKSIRPPDAIQLSCAAAARCDLFITNDDRLSRLVVPGIQFIVSLGRAYV